MVGLVKWEGAGVGGGAGFRSKTQHSTALLLNLATSTHNIFFALAPFNRYGVLVDDRGHMLFAAIVPSFYHMPNHNSHLRPEPSLRSGTQHRPALTPRSQHHGS
jgi:hypothetical protein